MNQPSTRRPWLPAAIGGFLVAVVAIGAWQVASRGFRVPLIQGQTCYVGVYSTQITIAVQPDLGYNIDCKKAVETMDQGLTSDNPFQAYVASAPPSSATLSCRFKVKHGEVSVHDGGGGGLLAGLLGPMICSKLRENPDIQLITS